METVWSAGDGNNRRAQSSTYLLPPTTNKGNTYIGQKTKIELFSPTFMRHQAQFCTNHTFLAKLQCHVKVLQTAISRSLSTEQCFPRAEWAEGWKFSMDREDSRNEVNMIFWSTMGFTLCGRTAKIFQWKELNKSMALASLLKHIPQRHTMSSSHLKVASSMLQCS